MVLGILELAIFSLMIFQVDLLIQMLLLLLLFEALKLIFLSSF